MDADHDTLSIAELFALCTRFKRSAVVPLRGSSEATVQTRDGRYVTVGGAPDTCYVICYPGCGPQLAIAANHPEHGPVQIDKDPKYKSICPSGRFMWYHLLTSLDESEALIDQKPEAARLRRCEADVWRAKQGVKVVYAGRSMRWIPCENVFGAVKCVPLPRSISSVTLNAAIRSSGTEVFYGGFFEDNLCG